MNENVDPYEVIRDRYESNVDSFILSDLFRPTLEVDEELIEDIKNNELIVYTAFTGDYDSLKEPEFIDENTRYVCFCQNPDLKSDTWEIIQMEDSTLDDNRIAKQYKVFPNKYFPDNKYSFWIDGSFKLVGSIREYIYKYVNSSMLNVVHPERDCIFDEAISSMHFPRYSNYTISKQVEKYRTEGMPEHYGLPVLGAIFRKHDDPEIISLMNQWWEEIINYTNQDQLSFTYLMWKNNFHPSVASEYYWINEYWTKTGNYHHNKELDDYITSRNLIKSLEGNIHEKNTLTKEEITLLFNDIDALRDEAEALNQVRNHWDRQINDIRDSTSWRLTNKFRNLRNKGDFGAKKFFNFLKASNFNFKSSMIYRRHYDAIKNSTLFNEDFYKKTYSDVSGDGLTHYLVKGYKEGKFPSIAFDPDFYFKAYPDVKQADLNPLLHYIAHGKSEGKFIQEAYSIRRKEEICETNLAFLSNYEFENEPLVSIIILNRDGLTHLKRLFKDFDKKTNYSNYEIIVVDNASKDDSVNYLKSLDLPITIIENDVNVSFSKGNNDAAKIANGEYLLLLNNDIEPTYGWLNELVGAMLNNENVASVGAKLIFPFYFNLNRDLSYKIQHSGDIFAERMYPCCLYAVNKSDSKLDLFDSSLTQNNQCISVTGAVTLINKGIYDELGGLDEGYFYGLEDVDFCLKLHKNNYKVIFAGNALLFHHESSTRVKSESYVENDKKNYSLFWSKWGQYLSRNLLLDKIHSEKFFTEKNLKITIIGDTDKKLIKDISKEFNKLNYIVELITDMENNYIGNSTDILLSFTDNYDLNNIIARDDIVKVIVTDSNLNTDDYDIVVSAEAVNCNHNIVISDDFVPEFLDQLEKIILDDYEF